MAYWKFRWLYLQSKGNGMAEYGDYEKNLTMKQREEWEQILVGYEQAFEKIIE